jgi:acyl-CoA thioesterase
METLNFNRHLGLKVKRLYRDGVSIECPIKTEYLNMHGTLHGGVTATLVDVAAGFACLAHTDGEPVTTVELKLNYFLPITGHKVTARSRILRAGATLFVCSVDILNEHGKLAGSGLTTYMRVPRRGA